MDWKGFLLAHSRLLKGAGGIPLGLSEAPVWPPVRANAPTVMLFSAHPDDEVLSMGPLAILFERAGWRVINVAITLGKPAQHERRLRELQGACAFMGYELVVLDGDDGGAVRGETRASQDSAAIKILIETERPQIILVHHGKDWHPAHMLTNGIVVEVLSRMRWTGFVFESEYWRQMKGPNLMVEVTIPDFAVLLAALSHHKGELARNPYHTRWPSLLSDNVRRAEVLLGRGCTPPEFDYAAIYRRSACKNGTLIPMKPGFCWDKRLSLETLFR